MSAAVDFVAVLQYITAMLLCLTLKVDEHAYSATCTLLSCHSVYQQAQAKISELNDVIASLEQQLKDVTLQRQPFTVTNIQDSEANVSINYSYSILIKLQLCTL